MSDSCRIVVISSSHEHSLELVRRIHALTNEPSDALERISNPPGIPESAKYIPWTISNRYYTADVHFLTHTVKGLAPYLIRNVPAIIFTWTDGTAYKHHVERLARDLNGSEPEISLAVRLPRLNDGDDDDDEENDEDVDIDDFLSTHGFEFIDAAVEKDASEVLSGGIPSLPRVLDALSTIMWPSMQNVKARSKNPLNWTEKTDSFDLSDDDLVVSSTTTNTHNELRRKLEMAELARWLEEDTPNKDDPWKADDLRISSPTEGFEDVGDSARFEDDFTVFVSAPPDATPEDYSFDTSFDNEDNLQPSSSGIMYHSLGSASDLGESTPEETDMPSAEEVKSSADRIFGSFPDSFSFGGDAAFDLEQVFSVLQGMKEEIAEIDDDSERRRAAAKVALGLVYGLDRNNDGDGDQSIKQ